MQVLPLFPLGTVLFPGMPLSLHIFEERYKAMIQRCAAADQPFGVVLIQHGMEAHGPLAQPHAIGCTAHITQIESLSQGRLNILVTGQERFRIHSLDAETEPYLLGEIEPLPLPNDDPAALVTAIKPLRTWMMRYLTALGRSTRVQIDNLHLPDEPLPLAYLAAALLQIPEVQKQPLLEAEDALHLVEALCNLYRREIVLLQVMLDTPPSGQDTGPFTPN
jgi:Lon protease-like protein